MLAILPSNGSDGAGTGPADGRRVGYVIQYIHTVLYFSARTLESDFYVCSRGRCGFPGKLVLK